MQKSLRTTTVRFHTVTSVKPIPEGYHVVTPYLVVQGAEKLIDFMKQAFDAKETERMLMPDGSIGHAEVRISDSVIMLGDARGETWKAMPSSIFLYVEDCDTVYIRALEAGATTLMEPKDQFYGDRSGGVKDPVGNHWFIATHKEDLTREELDKRAQDYVKQQQQHQ
jgi:PhnB protein